MNFKKISLGKTQTPPFSAHKQHFHSTFLQGCCTFSITGWNLWSMSVLCSVPWLWFMFITLSSTSCLLLSLSLIAPRRPQSVYPWLCPLSKSSWLRAWDTPDYCWQYSSFLLPFLVWWWHLAQYPFCGGYLITEYDVISEVIKFLKIYFPISSFYWKRKCYLCTKNEGGRRGLLVVGNAVISASSLWQIYVQSVTPAQEKGRIRVYFQSSKCHLLSCCVYVFKVAMNIFIYDDTAPFCWKQRKISLVAPIAPTW